MGRKSLTRALSVWANGTRIGVWRIPPRGPMELQYDDAWIESPAGRPLSLSLPYSPNNLPLRGDAVLNYFDNLLPDSEAIRARIASRFRTVSTDTFDLLQVIGRDCAGAVQLLDEDDAPHDVASIRGTPLTETGVEALLEQTVSGRALGTSGADGDEFRLSLAGAQEKTALLWHGGTWMLPHGATPTTHILKLPLGLVGNKRADLSTSVENEWLCLEILAAYGLPVARAEIKTFGAQKVLSVERFDRRLHASKAWLLRLPQEDFCQALGVPPYRKYEADGGPGMRDIAQILRRSERAETDIETLVAAQIVFWMLAAPDGHAKNFSLHLLPGGRCRLTPLYDVMSIWPVEGDGPSQWSWHKAKLAMAIEGTSKHYAMKEIQRRHFNAMAPKCFYGHNAEPIMTRLIEATPGVIQAVAARLPAAFPLKVAERIFKGLQVCAEQLDAAPA